MGLMWLNVLCVTVLSQTYGHFLPRYDTIRPQCSSIYNQEVLAQSPLIVYLHEPILSQPEIASFLDTHRPQVDASASTYSASMYLDWKRNAAVQTIVFQHVLPRVEHFFPNNTIQIESTALTRYAKGQSYSWHVDAYDEHTLHARAITFLLYLNDVDVGGETVFAHVAQNGSTVQAKESLGRACAATSSHVKVTPRAGKSLVFQNVPGRMSTHGSCVVGSEAKWIMQFWISATSTSTF